MFRDDIFIGMQVDSPHTSIINSEFIRIEYYFTDSKILDPSELEKRCRVLTALESYMKLRHESDVITSQIHQHFVQDIGI